MSKLTGTITATGDWGMFAVTTDDPTVEELVVFAPGPRSRTWTIRHEADGSYDRRSWENLLWELALYGVSEEDATRVLRPRLRGATR